MKARIRDNFTCQDCGMRRTNEEVKAFNKKVKYKDGRMKLAGRIRNLDVHHLEGLCGKKSRGYDRVQDIDVLITLCHKCHANREENHLWSEEYRLNRKKKRTT